MGSESFVGISRHADGCPPSPQCFMKFEYLSPVLSFTAYINERMKPHNAHRYNFFHPNSFFRNYDHAYNNSVTSDTSAYSALHVHARMVGLDEH